MLYSQEDAENITQETFLKVYQNLKNYQCNGKFSAFIFRISRNLVINHLKREKRKYTFSAFFEKKNIDSFLIDYNSPSNNLEKTEKSSNLKKLIMGLKEDQRTALVYKFDFNYSYKQISEITGWSIAKIETLVYRAKKNLKNLINMQEKTDQTVLLLGESK
jgi:RNA polymerase sigma-70 factor (ECF subfamily)